MLTISSTPFKQLPNKDIILLINSKPPPLNSGQSYKIEYGSYHNSKSTELAKMMDIDKYKQSYLCILE